MSRNTFHSLLAAALLTASSLACASTITLSGTIYDKVAAMPDFEDGISGVAPGMVSNTLVGGLPQYIGAGGYGAVASAASFDNWWVDTNGTQAFSLALNETSLGVFSYSSNSFFPIDGALAGNQGYGHNYHFTMHLGGLTNFTVADSFSFTGDDDLWVYIGGKLVMDLGGVHGAAGATVTGADLISKGLTAGTDYAIDIFFAERHTSESNFNITTSFHISPNEVPEPTSLLLAGLAMAGMAGIRRRRS